MKHDLRDVLYHVVGVDIALDGGDVVKAQQSLEFIKQVLRQMAVDQLAFDDVLNLEYEQQYTDALERDFDHGTNLGRDMVCVLLNNLDAENTHAKMRSDV